METRSHDTPTAPPLQRQKLSLPTGAKARAARPASSSPPVSNTQFWCVWGVGRRAPRQRHSSKEAAVAEADRLAGIHPARLFIVYEARAVARRVK
jgi:hypothetical protein